MDDEVDVKYYGKMCKKPLETYLQCMVKWMCTENHLRKQIMFMPIKTNIKIDKSSKTGTKYLLFCFKK